MSSIQPVTPDQAISPVSSDEVRRMIAAGPQAGPPAVSPEPDENKGFFSRLLKACCPCFGGKEEDGEE
jgi:hypothetical protein